MTKRHIVRAPGTDRYVLDLLEASDITPAAIGAPPVPVPGTQATALPPGLSQIFQFSGKNTDNALRHLNLGGGSMGLTTSVGEVRIIMPFAGRVQSLIVQLDAPFPDSDLGGVPIPNLARFTVRKNGTANDPALNTLLEVKMTRADIGSSGKADYGNSFTVVAGDYIGITYNEVTMNGGMTAGAAASVILVAT